MLLTRLTGCLQGAYRVLTGCLQGADKVYKVPRLLDRPRSCPKCRNRTNPCWWVRNLFQWLEVPYCWDVTAWAQGGKEMSREKGRKLKERCKLDKSSEEQLRLGIELGAALAHMALSSRGQGQQQANKLPWGSVRFAQSTVRGVRYLRVHPVLELRGQLLEVGRAAKHTTKNTRPAELNYKIEFRPSTPYPDTDRHGLGERLAFSLLGANDLSPRNWVCAGVWVLFCASGGHTGEQCGLRSIASLFATSRK